MLTADIRQAFLHFFERNGHKVLPSSPLIPHNDPSLLFANSGMVQFKNYFTGQEKAPFAKITTAQKCIRAGGKHNDLENVGYTARHHTFFEMMGNFSFGGYFKEEAITLAWTLLTKEFSIDPKKLYITVFSEDIEAASIWKKLTGFASDKIIPIATTDNFWSMGDTGPCGPCSEIFYDHGPHIPGGLPGTAEADGDRFVEVWNLVFMQFEQYKDGSRTNLPLPCIDTGMGLERMACVLQGVHNNYETDILKAIVQEAEYKTKAAFTSQNLVSERVIADHLRSASFLMADGVLPSNEGRGYVLRRIMRRAMRHAHLLGAKEPLMCQLVPTLVQKMGGAYPELVRAQDLIQSTLRLEEERFAQTLSRGLRVLEDEVSKYKGQNIFPGETAFKLYDTFGFPLDLTEDILKVHNMMVDTVAFTQAMEHQKSLARAAWVGSGEASTETIWFDLLEKYGPTEFLGYQTASTEGVVLAFVEDGTPVTEASKDMILHLITNQTPFYGESGGQVGDTGIVKGHHGRAQVLNTFKKAGKLYVHEIKVIDGYFRLQEIVEMKVDAMRRQKVRCNHSATHLLHAALQRRLGASVTQKGSLVAPDRLRFDFNYPHSIKKEVLRTIEQEINEQIRKDIPILTVVTTPDEAIKEGAQALFGEKYGEEVRVVTMGEDHHAPYSKELCGGTHVARTGEMGLFKIIAESGVSAGVRRIDAVTGVGAEEYVQETESLLQQASESLKTTAKLLPGRLHQLLEEKKNLEKEVGRLKRAGGNSLQEKQYETPYGSLWYVHISDLSPKDLKPLMDQLKERFKSGIILLTCIYNGKVSALVGVTNDLTPKIDARELIQKVATALGVKGGGGRPDLAQCGGDDPSRIPAAVQSLL